MPEKSLINFILAILVPLNPKRLCLPPSNIHEINVPRLGKRSPDQNFRYDSLVLSKVYTVGDVFSSLGLYERKTPSKLLGKGIIMRTILFASTLLLSAQSWAKCVPTAEWSGKLLPPSLSDRRSDGSIQMELENTPVSHKFLKGKIVRLVQKGALADLRYDVTFGPKALYWKEKDQLIVASGVDGWKKVSPLESLSHSRPNDVIRASLSHVSLSEDGETLTISREPVLLDGDQRCVVKFLKVDGDRAEVQHFDGKQESVRLDFKRHLPISADQSIALKGVENHSINQTGWDIFGHSENGEFVVESIEPYALHRVQGNLSEKFKNLKDYWRMNDSSKTTATQISYVSKDNKTPEAFKNGEKFLLVHSFGSYNDQGTTLGKFRGHSGLGVAEIKPHPITGELVYDVIYKQVYGQSKQGVFAASYHGHAYTGNLYRGRSFVRPMNDALYPMEGMGEGFQERLENAFDEMATGYRSGFGHGMARVTLMTSCVHDTGNVLIDVLNSSPKTPLLSKMARSMGRAVKPDAKFRNVELLPDNIDTQISTLLKGRKNLNLTIPRNFQDALVKAFIRDGKNPVVILQTIQVGDDLAELSPKAPDRINTLTGTLIQHWVNQLFN